MKKQFLAVIVLSAALFHSLAAQAQPCPGAKCVGADFSGRNMDRIPFVATQLDHAKFENTSMKGAQLMGALLRKANFMGADLSGANLQGAHLGEAALSANLTGANLTGAQMQKVILAFAKIDKTDMRGVNLEGSNLAGVNLSGADLSGANLANVNLKGGKIDLARVANANLGGMTMPDGSVCAQGSRGRCIPSEINGCKIQPGAKCPGANLARAQLGGVDLSGSDLKGANLDGAVLDGANLSRSQLDKASLKGTSFKGATLSQTRFEQVSVAGADFSKANLGKAVFGGVDLTGVKFTGASLSELALIGSTLSGTELRDVATMAGLKNAFGKAPVDVLQEIQSVAATSHGNYAQALKEAQAFGEPVRQGEYEKMRFNTAAELEKHAKTDFCQYLANYLALVKKQAWHTRSGKAVSSRDEVVSDCAAGIYDRYVNDYVVPRLKELKGKPDYNVLADKFKVPPLKRP